MKKVAVVCKLMPVYRLAIFNKLSCIKTPVYDLFGDNQVQGGIKTIPWKFAQIPVEQGGIRWIYTKSLFYKQERQLWQFDIVKRIFSNQYSTFVFEGAIAHFSTWIFAILCRITGKKVLFWTHGFKGTDKGIKKMVRTFYFKRLANGLLLYGDYSKKIMIKEGFNANSLFVVKNSLNYNEQKKWRKQYFKSPKKCEKIKSKIFSNNYNTIIFIGRLEVAKKVNKIIDCVKNLSKKNLPLNCIIIGTGSEKKFLEKKIRQYKLTKQFFFAGELYSEDKIAPLFMISDLMISPGNVGLNCIHAFAYGVPVLTHNDFKHQGPEVESIIPYKNGIFYQNNNFDDLENKILLWFSSNRAYCYKNCINTIEDGYNPKNQAELINNAIIKINNL